MWIMSLNTPYEIIDWQTHTYKLQSAKKDDASQILVDFNCIKHGKYLLDNVSTVTSPPSSKTNTSPCSNGDIVPASVLRYGSKKKIRKSVIYETWHNKNLDWYMLVTNHNWSIRNLEWMLNRNTFIERTFKGKTTKVRQNLIFFGCKLER